MSYLHRSNGRPLSTISFFPGLGAIRGLGGWQDAPNFGDCITKTEVIGYNGSPTDTWTIGNMIVTGSMFAPLGPVHDDANGHPIRTETLYPISFDSNCQPVPDLSRPTPNPLAPVQNAAPSYLPALVAASQAAQSASAPTITSTASPSGAPGASPAFLSSSTFGIPTWGLLAAGVGVVALFFMGGRR